MPAPPGPRALPSALTAVLDLLRCPRCGEQLAPTGGSLRCPARHTFDVARAGYASLLTGTAATSGDDDEMARARDRFLDSGVYAPIRDLITELVVGHAEARSAEGAPPAVLDVGCGTGYYLAGVLERLPSARGLGLDTSTRALRFAARAHERAAAASWDVFAPFPLRDASVEVLLDVFAPRNPTEFARVLMPGGVLVVVRPAPDHLAELREAVPGMVSLDPHKEERLHRVLDPLFTTERTEELRYPVDLSTASARDLVRMTPSARHVDAEQLEASVPSDMTVTVSVVASSHRVLPEG